MLLACPGSAPVPWEQVWGGGGGDGNGVITAPLQIYRFCRTVSARAPCGETAEMTNQGPWSLMLHCWYDRNWHRQIWQFFFGLDAFDVVYIILVCGDQAAAAYSAFRRTRPIQSLPRLYGFTVTARWQIPLWNTQDSACFFLNLLTFFCPDKCTWYVDTQVLLKFYPL